MAKPPHRLRSSHVVTSLRPEFVRLGVLLLLAPLYINSLESASAETRATAVPALVATAIDSGGPRRAQTDVSEGAIALLPRQSFEGGMAGGGRHLYQVSAGASQYLRVVVEQHGIILSAALADPAGAEIVKTDNPSGAHGPIYISAITGPAGDYRLEVQSNEEWANPGRYVVRVEELRPATPADRQRVAAEKSYAEARSLLENPKATQAGLREAISKFEDSLSYWRRVGDRHWVALTEFCVGVAYRSLGDRRAAGEHFGASLAVQLDEYDWRLRASTLNDMGANYFRMGEPERALKFLSDALNVYQSHQDQRGQASAHSNIGSVHLVARRYREAAENFGKALPLRRAERDRSGEAVVLNNMGGISDRLGEPYAALENYSAALRIWQELERRGELSNPLALPSGFNNVALAHDRLGNWQSALENYEEALRRYQGLAPVEAAKTLDNIGELYAVLGEPRVAMEYYNKARSLAEGVDPDAEANILSHIGQVYVAEGKLASALDFFERSLALRKSTSEQASAYTNIGAVYVLQGEPRRALASYERALKLSEGNEDRRAQALTLHKMGEARSLLGEHNRALEDFRRALPLWSAVADRRGAAATLHGIALAERGRKNFAEALKRSRESVDIIESLRTKVASHRLRTSYFASQQNHYELYIDLRMRMYQIDMSPQHLTAAIEASEQSRARSLLDTLAEARADISSGMDESLIKREREAQQRLNEKARVQMELLNRKHPEAAAIEREVREAVAEYDAVKAKIRASSPAYARLTQPHVFSLREMQQLLDEDTLLLEYLLGEEQSYLWLISNTSIVAAETLPKRSEIESLARSFYDSLTAGPQPSAGGSAGAPPAAVALSRMLLGRVTEQLGTKRLLVVGDGMLHYLPFGALPVPTRSGDSAERARAMHGPRPKQATYIVEEHEIVSLPSASTLAELRLDNSGRGPAPFTVAVLADPVFNSNDSRLKPVATRAPASPGIPARTTSPPRRAGGGALRSGLLLTPLPGTRREALAIRDAVTTGRVTIALGFEASRATLMKFQEGQYRVIHFATHGVLNTEHPELSGVVLSMFDEQGKEQEGVLRLHDIYNLKLPADLIVLSACSTGLGDVVRGEGMVSLTRGFMYAGSPRVVASLWLVEDLGTAELMRRFYHHMANDDMAPAAALRQAQIDLLKGRRWRSPYYWAGFVLQGEWKQSRRRM